MSMTVGDLKELLADLPEEMEVKLLTQPSWPFVHSIDSAQTTRELFLDQIGDIQAEREKEDDNSEVLSDDELFADELAKLTRDDHGNADGYDEHHGVLYIIAGRQERYASGVEWRHFKGD